MSSTPNPSIERMNLEPPARTGTNSPGEKALSPKPPPDLSAIEGRLISKEPRDILYWAIQTYRQSLVIATGFGPEGVVIIHLLSQIDPTVKILCIDTDLFFDETYALRDRLCTRFGLNIALLPCGLSLEKQAELYGDRLWERDPDLCCYLRKVEPLRRYLAAIVPADKRAWVTGIRRDQTLARANAKIVEWDATNGLVKINPLAGWSSSQVWETIRTNDLPFNPLHVRGYASIGCRTCTSPVEPGQPPRSGRWKGFAKTECGLHSELNRK